MSNLYDIGELVRVRGAFTTRELTKAELATFRTDGTLPASVGVDPDVVKVTVQDPSETETTYTYLTDNELVKAETGSYYVDVDANAVDGWAFRFFSTGGGQAAAEGDFTVTTRL